MKLTLNQSQYNFLINLRNDYNTELNLTSYVHQQLKGKLKHRYNYGNTPSVITNSGEWTVTLEINEFDPDRQELSWLVLTTLLLVS